MRILLALFILASFTNFAYTQQAINWTDSTKQYWFSNNEKALYFANKAILECDTNQHVEFGECLKNKGVVFYAMHNFDSAKAYYNKALVVFEKGNIQEGIHKIMNNLGILSMESQKLSEAVVYYDKAYDIAIHLSDTMGILRSLNNISNVYTELGNKSKSHEYLVQTLDYIDNYNNTGIKALTYGNLLSSYRQIGDFENFVIYSQKTLGLYKQTGDSLGLANTYTNMANGFEYFNMIDSAINLNTKALKIFTRKNAPTGMVHLHLSLGNNYRNLKNYTKSTSLYRTGLELAVAHEMDKYIREFHHELYINSLIAGNIEEAQFHQQKFETYDEKLRSQEVSAKLAEFETKYKTLEKEREIEKLSAEKAQQELKLANERRNLWLIISGFIIILLIIYVLVMRIRSRQKHVQTELLKKKAETENRLLRVQMNPHFMFNSLNSIQSYISSNRNELALEYLAQFAHLMRLILNHSRCEFVNLEDELTTLRIYLGLEKQRFNNIFDFKIIVDEDIDEDITQIPPMLIQPFVENAVIHGVAPLTSGGLITVKIAPNNSKTILCTIEDNGIGRKASAKRNKGTKHKSLGFQVTSDRIQLIEEQTGIRMSLSIEDLEPTGTQVNIIIPAKGYQ